MFKKRTQITGQTVSCCKTIKPTQETNKTTLKTTLTVELVNPFPINLHRLARTPCADRWTKTLDLTAIRAGPAILGRILSDYSVLSTKRRINLIASSTRLLICGLIRRGFQKFHRHIIKGNNFQNLEFCEVMIYGDAST